MHHVALLVVALAAAVPALAQPAPPVYSLKDLGTIGAGKTALAYGLNGAGDVVGTTEYKSNSTDMRAFIARKGFGPTQLGNLGGSWGEAHAVNDAGAIVGFEALPGDTTYHAVLYGSGDAPPKDLTIPLGASTSNLLTSPSAATGIDSAGRVVGWFTSGFGDIRAFLWTAGTGILDRHALAAPNEAQSMFTAINNRQHIVGHTVTADFKTSRAFLYKEPEKTTQPLGTLGGTFSEAYDINDSDRVVGGAARPDGSYHAFRTGPGMGINPADDLGVLDGQTSSEAHGINNAGDVVGTSSFHGRPGEQKFTPLIRRAFLYTDALGKMTDLNALVPSNPGTIVEAHAINDAGQIAAIARVGTDDRAVLLSICGNGVVDPGETCDERDRNGKDSCCTASCTLRKVNEVCRAVKHPSCDTVEVCDGTKATCPNDVRATDGTSCDDGDKCNGVATCNAGDCTSTPILDCRAGDSDVCTHNPCDPVQGCTAAVPIAGCDPARATEALVGGPTNLCTGGTVVGGNCEVTAGSVKVSIPPGALPKPIALNVADLPTAGTCPACTTVPGQFALKDDVGRLIRCISFEPRNQTFAVPIALTFSWTNSANCTVRRDCPSAGTSNDGRLQIFHGTAALTEMCHPTSCPVPTAANPQTHSCLDPAVCCRNPPSCASESVCDPFPNTWLLKSVKRF